MQKTQGRGTHSSGTGTENSEGWATRPGMLADFVVLDRDPTAASPEKLLATKVLRTVVGGKTVYEAK
ncbi:MAG TPA: amidohydrolase family protein [Candidatus Sulfotelmatobacter sp.]|nr:amidohydrolase family protein [Candidatus Sulfotelmatobacter sp.]